MSTRRGFLRMIGLGAASASVATAMPPVEAKPTEILHFDGKGWFPAGRHLTDYELAMMSDERFYAMSQHVQAIQWMDLVDRREAALMKFGVK